KDALLRLVDEDTNAFNKIIEAVRMPKSSDAEKMARNDAMQAATKYAIEVPLKVMELSLQTFEVIQAMAEKGNPSSVTDAAVGGLCARAAVHGAYLNVKVNTGDLDDKVFVKQALAKGLKMTKEADKLEAVVLKMAHSKIEK
ncbi:MAG: glutamate formiminotransferase/formiminotetrahydrofolate cyclodeaminase, partial [Saprospiraceae bacterium]